MNREKMKIDFTDLLKRIFLNKKKLIIFTVIGLILGLTVCFGTGKNKTSNLPTKIELKAKAKKAKNKLSKEEQQEVYNSYKSYSSIKNLKQKVEKMSNDSSLLTSLDGNGKAKTVVYIVDGNEKSSSIVYAYQSLIMNKDMYNKIREVTDPKYTDDMIDQIVNITSDLDTSDLNDVNINTNSAHTLEINIYGNNVQECDKIYTLISERINVLKSDFLKKIDDFNQKVAGTSYNDIDRTNIVKIKNSYLQQIDKLNNAMSSIAGSITDSDQIDYFTALIDMEKSGNKKTLSKKNIIVFTILGGVLGALIYIIYLCLKYIFSGVVHTEKNFEQLFNINILAHSTNIERIVSEMDLFISNNPNKTLLASSLNKEYEDIYKNLDHDTFSMLKGYPNSEKDFEIIKNVKQVVLIEVLDSSRIKDIANIIEYYNKRDIKVAGVILFEN